MELANQIYVKLFTIKYFFSKILKETKGNGFQKKMLHWLPGTMLEPITQIRDSRPVI
ncbi:hypothetical protein Goshw_027386 [Gossypium schwendimanii]|uniref:Uncharacterized protein n=1 Tax=Gossypium schwendimanii TaxID=34291 RepID=A0A7J9NE31_GOSSC|nr:hypothetical protein [Gossypium schwendimanii]